MTLHDTTTAPTADAAAAPERKTVEQVLAAVIFGGVTAAAAGLGSVITGNGQDWYDSLSKPSFNPPDAAFGIVWTVLYVAIAVAGWLAWRSTRSATPTIAWSAQMALNFLWTAVFFGTESPTGGLVVIVALTVAISVTIAIDLRRAPLAAALLTPYLAWVLFAAALDVAILVEN
jgi:tryptophan-rich sensory protein